MMNAVATAFESFSHVASDWVRLRLALYGPRDAQALMLRCFRLQRGRNAKVNERTVLAAWSEQDAALEAALDSGAELTQAQQDAVAGTMAFRETSAFPVRTTS